MNKSLIKYKGKDYTVRSIYLGEDFGEFTVASRNLRNKLLDKTCNYVSAEARAVDEQIFFYIEPWQFAYTDDKLRVLILRNII